MACRELLIFLSIILPHLFVLTTSEPDFIRHACSNEIGNYTTNSTYQYNLNTLLTSLPNTTQIDHYGFYKLSVGQTPNQVNAIALCRGDITLEECRNCVNNSTRKILQACPNQKEAIGWYDFCMLRYSNKSILSVVEEQPTFNLWDVNNASDVNRFNDGLERLLTRLRSIAASGNSLQKFATGNESAGFETVYGLVQCTPDLSEEQCDDCLVGVFRLIPDCCDGKLGGRILKPSCNLEFSVSRFYRVTPPPIEGRKSSKARTIIIIVIGVPTVTVGVFFICVCIFFWCRMRTRIQNIHTRMKKAPAQEPVDEIEAPSPEPVGEIEGEKHLQSSQLRPAEASPREAMDERIIKAYKLDLISSITSNFDEKIKIGQGGFGKVYKATLPNREQIAVKRLSQNSEQGDKEFENEVRLMANLQHRNVAGIKGFCKEGNERILIYEYMPKGSLDHILFGPNKSKLLDWKTRSKIIGGIARGLLYLHQDSPTLIIHLDLKASNILLDANMNAKICDFGISRLFTMDQTRAITQAAKGTIGYMAPEYAMEGQFSVKSDVYSFGLLVLEIVRGERIKPKEKESILSHVKRNWDEGTPLNLMDTTLRTDSATNTDQLKICIGIGLRCVQHNAEARPTMQSIVQELESLSLSAPGPSQPALLMRIEALSEAGPSQPALVMHTF